jgi:hypothetical protein
MSNIQDTANLIIEALNADARAIQSENHAFNIQRARVAVETARTTGAGWRWALGITTSALGWRKENDTLRKQLEAMRAKSLTAQAPIKDDAHTTTIIFG